MRVLAENECQFAVLAACRGDGPAWSYDATQEGYWSVKVVASWWSPIDRVYVASASVFCRPITETHTAESVVREQHLRGVVVDRLNEKLRELIVDAAAVQEYLERPVWMVSSREGLESIHTDLPGAQKYVETLRKEIGVSGLVVTPVEPKGRIRDLLTEVPREPKESKP